MGERLKKLAVLLLAAIMVLGTVSIATGCGNENKAEKRRIMMAYMKERYGEKFTFEEYLSFNDGLTIFDIGDSYVYGINVVNKDGQRISVQTNWRKGEKPDEVKCYDNYLEIKYLRKLENYLTDLRGQIFGASFANANSTHFTMSYPSMEEFGALPGNIGYHQFLSWYSAYTIEKRISFYVDALADNLDEVYGLEVERLEAFKQELKKIGAPISFHILYRFDKTRYRGIFTIDENWNYSELEFSIDK